MKSRRYYCIIFVTIDENELDAVCQCTYLGSTITDNLSLDAYINKRVEEAASTLARLTARVCTSPQAVCEDKYGSLQCLCYQHIALWQRNIYMFARQERRCNTFHLRSIRHILGIYPRKTKCPTLMSCLMLVFPVCTL